MKSYSCLQKEEMSTEEKVGYAADPNNPDRFMPKILGKKTTYSGGKKKPTIEKFERDFEGKDMLRVNDYDNLDDPPKATNMKVCEGAAGKESELQFPVRHITVRGGFLFYFDQADVEETPNSYHSYTGPPLGVIPLHQVQVLLPPGGRRVFQHHSKIKDLESGYEFVVADQADKDRKRPPVWLVANSNGAREAWIAAMQLRAKKSMKKDLKGNDVPVDTTLQYGGRRDDVTRPGAIGARGAAGRRGKVRGAGKGEGDDYDAQMKRDTDKAKNTFGVSDFSEEKYLNDFFQTKMDFDAGATIDELQQWQDSIKQGLRGAVLKQYTYFVDASKEMTTMGKEVSALKNAVEIQNDKIQEMKDLDFTAAFGSGEHGSVGEDENEDLLDEDGEGQAGRKKGRRRGGDRDDISVDSSLSSDEEDGDKDDGKTKDKKAKDAHAENPEVEEIEIPSWLDDVNEEITAFIKECRYTDATDLLFKAKTEVNDILTQSDRLSSGSLSKKQHVNMTNTMNELDKSGEKMCSRLVEGLRRKNEALKQAGKRERSDPLSLMAPMVSPCCLGDDSIPLHLLVKLGKTQEAATAYAARRSLLLLESLHERPISGTGNIDLVIYAAQLSQSFFSCLAGAVEGFLDLFLVAGAKGDDDDTASMLTNATRNVPPGALASIVLWCDSELSKFSSAFGGTRILGNLALSPPPRQETTSKARMVGFEDDGNQSMKDRQQAIEVAAKCVEQAFQYACENLDSIGLPLTPRLAEYIRSRLKGCESEVSKKLAGKWKHITFEWEIEVEQEDIPMDERRR